jgi:hypothetical protein
VRIATATVLAQALRTVIERALHVTTSILVLRAQRSLLLLYLL